MDLHTLDKKTKLLLAGLFLLCAALLLISFSLLRSTTETNTSSTSGSQPQQPGLLESFFPSQLRVLSVDPNYETLLSPNQTHTFLVTFNKALRLDAISVTLQETIIPTGETSPVKTSLTAGSSDTMAIISSETPLKPYASYVLTIQQKNPPKKLYGETYGTQNPLPSPVAENNTKLKTFLPYQTATYALSYREDVNMYVFNFIYNPNDPTPPQQQFETAQQNARLYMQSKGVNPNSVIVDWRFR